MKDKIERPASGKGSRKQAPLFFSGDPRSALGGKARKRKRIGRESALATCRRMNFDGFEDLILFAQGNTEALHMEPGSITGQMRLGAVKEALTYVMTKKQIVTVAPDTGGDGAQGVQVMVVAPNSHKTVPTIELMSGDVITMDLSEKELDDIRGYDDGILSDDLLSEAGYIDID